MEIQENQQSIAVFMRSRRSSRAASAVARDVANFSQTAGETNSGARHLSASAAHLAAVAAELTGVVRDFTV